MIRLDLGAEPEWLELAHGVRLRLRPLRTSVMMAARSDPAVTLLLDGRAEELGLAVAKAVARIVVLDWEGVGDADGNPVPVTPEGVDALLEHPLLFTAFEDRYLGKSTLLDAEKNGSAPSPDGATAGATDTATPARPRARTARRG